MNGLDQLLRQITEKRLPDNGRVFALPMRTKDIVTVEGSVLGGWRLLPKQKEEAAVLAARLFDAGTKKRSKETVRELIAQRGASLSFSAGADRTFFDLSCLPEDLPMLLDLLVECLGQPLFSAKEFESTRARLLSTIKNRAHDTRSQAGIAIGRMMYDPKHPNCADTNEERLRNIANITLADIKTFHRTIGRGGLVLSIVGDIDTKRAIFHAERAFSALPKGIIETTAYPRNTKKPRAALKLVPIKDKANIDVYLGASLPFRYGEDAYFPSQLFAAMLGDGGTAHLMDTVRDRDGLTYHIQAGLSGVSTLHDGEFYIYATFAPELFDQGIAAIQSETRKFLARGIREETLQARKEELIGSYLIGLSTTGAMAGMLHRIGIRNQDVSYLTEYPKRLAAVTLAQVKAAGASIPFGQLSIAAAGTFLKKAN